MTDHPTAEAGLRGRTILVVEDEYFIAIDLEQMLEKAGARVVGPASSLAQALRLIDSETQIDGAILDINLSGERVYPAADRLVGRGIPIVFATGYGDSDLPERFARVPRCEKPIDAQQMEIDLVGALGRG